MNMKSIYLEIGLFNIILVSTIFKQVYENRKIHRDCLLFSRLLFSIICILVVDTAGWIIDGDPLWGQIWITEFIDGLNLVLTVTVCWCWLQYAYFIVQEDSNTAKKKLLLISHMIEFLQIILIIADQKFHLFYFVDEAGVYHRGQWYYLHILFCLILLLQSSVFCIWYGRKTIEVDKKKELYFVAFIIAIPVFGACIHSLFYGYPTIWISMICMILIVFIHIQNKRVDKERTKQNEQLKKALIDAEAANRSKSTFLSNMSHDIRTPLNAILGLTSLSLDEPNIPSQIQENLENIHSSGDFLLRLVNDILDMERIEAGKIKFNYELYDHNDFVNTLKTMFEPLCMQKNIDFSFETAKKSYIVKADRLRVNQIFFNILSNAIKYTNEGGKVSYRTENFKIENGILKCDYIISDTGIGMTPEFMERIYHPFEQEDNSYKSQLHGSGLGLSIAKNLIDMMHGNIEIQSEPNKGTTVRIHLDFEVVSESAEVEQKMDLVENSDEAKLVGKHVLLVEDHPLNAAIAIKILEKKGMIVKHAENGKIAVDDFSVADLQYYDVVIMDIRMPVMDGLEATRMIRSLNREDATTIPIIAMTANAYEEDMRMTREAGMNEHLSKPIEPEALYRALIKYLK